MNDTSSYKMKGMSQIRIERSGRASETLRLKEEDYRLMPQQPFLKQLPTYREQLIKWNPFSIKNKALSYQFQTDDSNNSVQIVPDGCFDFLFKCSGESPLGLFKGVHMNELNLELEPNTLYFGFKPYCLAGSNLAKTCLSELIEQTLPLEDVFRCTKQVTDEMISSHSFQERITSMLCFALENMVDSSYIPEITEHMELMMCNAHGNMAMKDVSESLYYSSRHCRSKFKDGTGISPKNYASVMRFQHTLRLCSNKQPGNSLDFNRIVDETGYYDQSHLIMEFRRFTGHSPKKFFANLNLSTTG